MRINYNVSAMLANNNLTNSNNALSKSIQRLSSGLKINNAKDNPAGLAMAKRLNGQIAGTGVAKQNSADGISVIETADGALSEVHSMLHRISELATQAANGTQTDDDRKVIQAEIDELKGEVQHIFDTTWFNGQSILNGTFDYKGYSNNTDVRVSTINSEVNPGDDYVINRIEWNVVDSTGRLEVTNMSLAGTDFPSNDFADYTVSMTDNFVKMSHPSGFEMTLEIDEKKVFDPATDEPVAGSVSNIKLTCTDIGPMRLQVGANEGHVVSAQIPALNLGNIGISHLSVKDQETAGYAIDRVKDAIQSVSSVRGKLGAYQNRLESIVDNLGVVDENMTSAYSRFMDVDMAEEMTEYSTHNIIVQAGTSVLAQANERPSQVLQLLQ